MSKKHLDELFQERFKGFEESPDEKVWSAIEASLDKRKKKRILPLWWQLAGVAAVLIVGLLLFNPFDNMVSTDTHTITDTEQTERTPELSKDRVQTKGGNGDKTEMNGSSQSKDGSISVDESSVANTDSDSNGAISTKKAVNSADTKKNNRSNRYNGEATRHDGHQITKNKGIAEQSFPEKEQPNTEITSLDTKDSNNNPANITNEDAFIGKGEIVTANEAIAAGEENRDLETKIVDEKKSLYDEIEALEEEEEIVASKTSGNRWSAGPSIAPVYFDAIGTGSPVSPVFSANSKSGNVNMSYGLSVAYEISPKLSVRSGVHKVDYAYNTNDVFFTSSLSAFSENRIANINYSETAENIVVSSSNASLNFDSKSFDVSARSVNRSGVMAQQLGYLEVPVELSYALIDTKFGIHVIGGVSSLFLLDNEVDLTSGNLTTQIGEANNVNDLNFSANFGIGLGYQFSQKLKLNVEPVFKYQLNTFSNVDGTFNPYTIGVYSGISFKF